MRVAFLFKRMYMRHDVIEDRYGRLYELPTNLAALGHDVLVVCLCYRSRPPGESVHSIEAGCIRWCSLNSGPALVLGLPGYYRAVSRRLKGFDPHVLVSGSDALHVINGALLSSLLRRPHIVDLYDNLEAFGLTRVPGVTGLYRWALRRSAAVTTVSETLKEHVDDLLDNGLATTLETTIDPQVFQPRDKREARSRLGIPHDRNVVAVAGALDDSRDINCVLDAFEALSVRQKSLIFLFAGTKHARLGMRPDQFRHLGQLPHSEMPWFYCAADLVILPLADTAFGKFAFPQKAYEILGCRVPILAARVGSVARLLARYPTCLYEPGSADSLVAMIELQLRTPADVSTNIPSWRDQAVRLSRVLEGTIPAT